jgi:ATP-binding cassette subfamily B multidrug efflux pump
MSDFEDVLKYLIPYKRDAIIAIILLGVSVIGNLAIPRLVQVIVDQGIAQKNISLILTTSLLMIGASILSAIFTIANTIYAVRASRSFEADLREAIFKKIQSFSFGNLDDFQTGQLMTRLSSDVTQVQTIVTMFLRMFTQAPLMFVGSVFIMYSTNARLATYMLILLPVVFVMVAIFIRNVQPLFTRVQGRLDYLNQVLQENLSGVRVVKAFVRRDYEDKRFEKANVELTGISAKVTQLLNVFFPMVQTIMNLATVAIIYYGGLQVYQGTATVGEILAFTNYIFSTMFPVIMLSMMAGQISAANASAVRIMQVMNSTPDVQNKENATLLKDITGKITFDNVCFSYLNDGGDPVLQNISFTANPGQTVAILGSTGSGKTSLINLIPRFYDVTEGKVMVDGIDVRDVDLSSLRSKIGISLQEAVLFSGTIKDNIRYGRTDANDEEVIHAAKIAQAHEFIMEFEDGYETMVGQRGTNLSGGQKQRIAIARALLVNPKILILDDSTSSVDVETEAEIDKALRGVMKDRTSFIIAQRISTVLNADKILVLDNGRIAAEGNHKSLMEKSPIYQEIYDSQLGGMIQQ